MSSKNKKSILSYLKVLMLHIIKWKSQEEKRSNSWKNSIKNSRKKIDDIQIESPSLNEDFLLENWDKTFDKAKKEAEGEMKKKSKISGLNWKEVFTNKYTLIFIFLIVVAGLIYGS